MFLTLSTQVVCLVPAASKFEEDLFRIEGDQASYLTSTAEVPVTNMYKDEILENLFYQ